MWIFKRSLFIPIIFDLVDPLIRCMFFRYGADTSYVRAPSERPAPGQHIGAGYTQNPQTNNELTQLTNSTNPGGREIDNSTLLGRDQGGAVIIKTFPPELEENNRPFVFFYSSPTQGGVGTARMGLPMPSNLSFQDQAQYGSAEASATEMGIKDGPKSALAGALKDVGRFAATFANAATGGKIGGAAMRTAGVAKNPNILTEFNSMGVRRFAFSWKLMPRNSDEATNLRHMQYSFQARAYPTVIVADAVLKYPPKWNIIFFQTGRGTLNLPKIGQCYLESVSYNVNPSGTTWHHDGNPGEVDLGLNFIETKAFTAEDIIKLQAGGKGEDSAWANSQPKPLVDGGGGDQGTGGDPRGRPGDLGPASPTRSR